MSFLFTKVKVYYIGSFVITPYIVNFDLRKQKGHGRKNIFLLI